MTDLYRKKKRHLLDPVYTLLGSLPVEADKPKAKDGDLCVEKSILCTNPQYIFRCSEPGELYFVDFLDRCTEKHILLPDAATSFTETHPIGLWRVRLRF